MADKTKKKKKKWLIPVIIAAVVVVLFLVFVLPIITAMNSMQNIQVMSTATAEKGRLEKTVVGSGTLSSGGTEDVKIPASVKVEHVNVEAGDTVEAGDVLATIDQDSVTDAILATQTQIATLDGQIDSAQDSDESTKLKSTVSGRVKEIFVEDGDKAEEVIAQYGGLMTVSLDGKMRVEFDTAADLSVGDEVTVTMSSGTEKIGKVASITGGACVVTVTDNGPKLDDEVTVSKGGEELGKGKLAINTPMKLLSQMGTVEDVKVELDDSVTDSTTLLTFAEGTQQKSYDSLLKDRDEQEKQLRTLGALKVSGVITAPYSGIISEVSVEGTDGKSGGSASADSGDDNSGSNGNDYGDYMPSSYTGEGAEDAENTSLAYTAGSEVTFELLSADAADGSGYLQAAAAVEIIDPVTVPITKPVTGAAPQSVITGIPGVTATITWTPADAQFAAETAYTANVTLKAGAGIHFAPTATATVPGATVAGVTISPEVDGNTLTFSAVFPPTDAIPEPSPSPSPSPSPQPSPSADPSAMPSGQGQGGTGSMTGGMTTGDLTGGSSSYSGSLGSISGGSYSGSGSSSGTGSSSGSGDSDTGTGADTSLDQVAFTMLTGGANKLAVDIDELDILNVEPGQTASIVLDALPEEEFTAVVTKVSDSGNQQSGVTTYPVTLELEGAQEAGLKAGMNATATITVAIEEDVLQIPMDALFEGGGEKYVLVQESEVPQGGTETTQGGVVQGNMVISGENSGAQQGERRVVTTGLSDGINVEITSGLSEGEVVMWTPTTSENPFMQMFGGMGGGGMAMSSTEVSGGPPDGDRVERNVRIGG